MLMQFPNVHDNDQLSAGVSTLIGAQLLILLSNVEGVYTAHPSLPSSKLIHTYQPEHEINIKFWEKSPVGRGGMESKVNAG